MWHIVDRIDTPKKRKIRWKWVYAGALIFVVLAVVLGFNIADKLAKGTMAGTVAVNGFVELDMSQIRGVSVCYYEEPTNIDEEDYVHLIEYLRELKESKIQTKMWRSFAAPIFIITFTDNSTLEVLNSTYFVFSSRLKSNYIGRPYYYNNEIIDYYYSMTKKYLGYPKDSPYFLS